MGFQVTLHGSDASDARPSLGGCGRTTRGAARAGQLGCFDSWRSSGTSDLWMLKKLEFLMGNSWKFIFKPEIFQRFQHQSFQGCCNKNELCPAHRSIQLSRRPGHVWHSNCSGSILGMRKARVSGFWPLPLHISSHIFTYLHMSSCIFIYCMLTYWL